MLAGQTSALNVGSANMRFDRGIAQEETILSRFVKLLAVQVYKTLDSTILQMKRLALFNFPKGLRSSDFPVLYQFVSAISLFPNPLSPL